MSMENDPTTGTAVASDSAARPMKTDIGRTERKRRLIVEAASDLFLTHGFSGTSMDDVASRAAVSKQTVYKQFANKEALFIAIVQTMTYEAAARVQIDMRDPRDPGELATALRMHASRLLAIVLAPRLLQLRRLVIAEAGRFPDLGKALYDGGPARSMANLATAFARWAGDGLLIVDDPGAAASHFNWLIMGEPINQAMFRGDDALPGPAQRETHVAAGVRVFLAAYGSAQDRS